MATSKKTTDTTEVKDTTATDPKQEGKVEKKKATKKDGKPPERKYNVTIRTTKKKEEYVDKESMSQQEAHDKAMEKAKKLGGTILECQAKRVW